MEWKLHTAPLLLHIDSECPQGLSINWCTAFTMGFGVSHYAAFLLLERPDGMTCFP